MSTDGGTIINNFRKNVLLYTVDRFYVLLIVVKTAVNIL